MERLAERIGDAIRSTVETIASAQIDAVEQVSTLSIDSELTPRITASSHVAPAKAKVIAYLRANPSAAQLSARKLAERIGVNHETVRQVLRELRGI